MSRSASRLLIGLAILWLGGCSGAAPLPAKAAELNQAGVEALAQGDLETAEADFELALEYSPRFVEALVNQGLVELQRGNFRRARQLLARARRINPDVAQPHHGLGVLEEREHRPDRASVHYREALSVDPGFAPSRLNYARMLFASGELDHAREQFKKLTEVAPDEPLGYSGLSETLIRLGRVSEAEAVTERGLAHCPRVPELLILKARSRIRRGYHDQAISELLPLTGGSDDIAVHAFAWIATAELAGQRPRRAVGAARRALDLDPDEPVAVYALAMALYTLGDSGARPWLKRAAALAPGDPAVEAALAAK